ncbi:MAG: histidine kinase [Thermoleophilia bacterium]|nr:histidine kinase [Thermoleophilia bacterium]
MMRSVGDRISGWNVGSAGIGLLVLMLVLLVASLVEIWLPADPVTRGWGGLRWASTLIALASISPLLVMRRYPVGAIAVSFAAACGNILLTAPHQASFEGFVALVVLVYGAGAYLEGWRAIRAIVALEAAVVVVGVLLAFGQGYDSLEFLAVTFWFAMAWVVGRLVRSWQQRAEQLERLTTELAAERDARAQAAVEAERIRIAHELHDVVAHNVSVMTIQATAASRILASDPDAARDALASAERTGRETVDEMLILLGVLRERGALEPFAPQPGLAELEALATRVGGAGLPVEVVIEGRPRPLGAGLDLAAYRIIQEALTNALKHAGGGRAQVTVRYTETALELEVVDDGVGSGGGGGTGNGLVGMKERAEMYGGQVEMGRRKEGGWGLRAVLPVGST